MATPDWMPEAIPWRAPRLWLVVMVIGFLTLLPAFARLVGEPFYLTLFSRIMIYALAAVSLNLLIGYTGLVSLGHALFLGVGAYSVALLDFHGVGSGWLQLAVALSVSALIALLTGLICLRTSGVAFIMITLAFAQMFFYLIVSLKQYGGDDGLRLNARSTFGRLDLASNELLYYLILFTLLLVLYASWRLVHAKLGYLLRGIKANERRMRALGYATTRYKLLAYVIAGTVTSLAGLLLANLSSYASPAYGAWTVSGDLMVMVVLGGVGTIFGPVLGALAFLLFEELLSSFPLTFIADHWMLYLGALIVLSVRIAKRGLYGSFRNWSLRIEAAATRAQDKR